jgi:uncharacterized membrane protein YGL010W
MTVSFYLTGKERSGVVAVKVQKVYFFILSFNLITSSHSSRIFQINLFMIIFLFNLIGHGIVEISFKFTKISIPPPVQTINFLNDLCE